MCQAENYHCCDRETCWSLLQQQAFSSLYRKVEAKHKKLHYESFSEGNENPGKLPQMESDVSKKETHFSKTRKSRMLFNQWLLNFKTAISRIGQTERTRQLLNLKRKIFYSLTGVLRGHCSIGSFAYKHGLLFQDYCRRCYNMDEMESLQQLLCKCLAFQDRCHRFFDNGTFKVLDMMANWPNSNGA